MQISFYDIIQTIKDTDIKDRRLPFLVSLACNLTKFSSLTEKQEQAFLKMRSEINTKEDKVYEF